MPLSASCPQGGFYSRQGVSSSPLGTHPATSSVLEEGTGRWEVVPPQGHQRGLWEVHCGPAHLEASENVDVRPASHLQVALGPKVSPLDMRWGGWAAHLLISGTCRERNVPDRPGSFAAPSPHSSSEVWRVCKQGPDPLQSNRQRVCLHAWGRSSGMRLCPVQTPREPSLQGLSPGPAREPQRVRGWSHLPRVWLTPTQGPGHLSPGITLKPRWGVTPERDRSTGSSIPAGPRASP